MRVLVVCFYAVGAVDPATRLGYLDHAYRLGRDFALASPPASSFTA